MIELSVLLGAGAALALGLGFARMAPARARAGDADRQAQQRILEATPFPIAVIGARDGLVLYVNRPAAVASERSQAELVGRRATVKFVDRDVHAEYRERLRRDGRVERFEVRLRNANGREFWALLSAEPIAYAGEEAVLVTFLDVTAEREARDLQRRLVDAMPVPTIVSALADGRILQINRRGADLLGLPPDGAGRSARDLYLDPADRDAFLADLDASGGFLDAFETRLRSASGECVWVLMSTRRFSYLGEEAILTALSMIDRRKRLEEQVARQTEILTATFENMDQGIMMADRDLRVVAHNGRLLSMFDMPPGSFAEGTGFDGFLRYRAARGDFGPSGESYVRQVLEQLGKNEAVTYDTRLESGQVIEVRSNPLPDGGCVRTYTDVTERRRALDAQRELLEAVPVPLLLGRMADGSVLQVNPRAAELFGMPRGDAAGLPLSGLAEDQGAAERLAQRLREDGHVDEFELRLRDAHGRAFWSLISARLLVYRGEQAMLLAVNPIDARKRIEQELDHDKRILRATLENMDQAMLMTDARLRVIGWNHRCVDLLDLPAEFLETGPTLAEVSAYHARHGEEDEFSEGGAALGLDEDGTLRVSRPALERRRPNGVVVELRINRLPGGGVVCTYTDVTERKDAEDEMRMAGERLRAILDASPVGVVISRLDGSVLWTNQRLADQLGLGREGIQGSNARVWYADPDLADAVLGRLMRDGAVRDVEAELCRADGTFWWALLSVDELWYEGGPALMSWFYDITGRKRGDAALRQSEERLKLAVSATRSGIWDVDYVRSTYWWSPEFLAMLGYAEGELSMGRGTWEALLHPEDRERAAAEVRRYLDGATPEYRSDYRLRRRDGGHVWIEAHATAVRDEDGLPLRFTGIMLDVTHQREAEADLRAAKEAAERAYERLRLAQDTLVQSEKMAALGSLVAGVAHEINTPIGTALTAASHLGERTKEFGAAFREGRLKRSEAERYVETASETADIMVATIGRAAELIQSFKRVAVDQSTDGHRRFDLRDYLAEVLLSLRPRLRPTAHQVTLECPEGIEIDGYPGALSQVLTNFIMNSLLHAFGEKQAGHIGIRVREINERCLEILYSDDGSGIPRSHLSRLFDPFFTTRRGAGGTGLGLHIVYNIVTQSLGGTIEVRSEEGQGATFVLVVPRTAPAGSDA